MSDLADLARRYYRAYEDDDRGAMEAMLAPDFTFTSPYDDAISREAFFLRCWPNHVWLDKFHLELVLVEGNRVMVLYRFEARPTDAKRPNLSFRNAECLTFENGRLSHVDVFFDKSPVFALLPDAQLKHTSPVAWYSGKTTLASGWAWGQEYLDGAQRSSILLSAPARSC